MPLLTLKPSHKAVAAYYAALRKFEQIGVKHETAVRSAFQTLLDYCAKQCHRVLVPEYRVKRKAGKPVIADGAIVDQFTRVLSYGLWEAKDSQDDLEREIKAKFAAGYPKDNILFQAPTRGVLYQDGQRYHDTDLSDPDKLIHILELFFTYRPPVFEEWEQAVDEFKERVPQLGGNLAKLVRKERQTNSAYKIAFIDFLALCRASLNPSLSENAVEEMLVQHLLTERIFRRVFDVADFMRRNIIAAEIERVIQALISKNFDRDQFTKALDPFYVAIERAAETIHDYSEKQKFLNTVYERFFQGFSVKIADTHGIVYTPQPLVDFMVSSVEHVLKEHFDTGLAEQNVHILDPFTGTGNFIVNLMERMTASALKHKYAKELFCNEVMLLPYYVASMNIEHLYSEKVGTYEAFEGICLVDTFETAEKGQRELFSMTEENTERVKRQRKAPIKVIIANPPYNAGQLDENDNNKNRKYPEIDARVKYTYSEDSAATLLRKLSDPYVKAIRYATDRLGENGANSGIVCFVNNNSFITEKSFDGMRKHLEHDFDLIYLLDLGGNVRKHPTLSGTTHNVFGIQVGVSINVFIRLPRKPGDKRKAKIRYQAVPIPWTKEEKYDFLEKKDSVDGVNWTLLKPNQRHDWLTNANDEEFAKFTPLGTKDTKASGGSGVPTIFRTYSLGVSTNRDSVVYDFNEETLLARCERFADEYNAELDRWKKKAKPPKDPKLLVKYVDDFVDYSLISWSRNLKRWFRQDEEMVFDSGFVRDSAYRPFTQKKLYFKRMFVDEVGSSGTFFPNAEQETENLAIAVNLSPERPFCSFAINRIPSKDIAGGFGSPSYCFPLYTYSADGEERRDNIPRSTLDSFAIQYDDDTISRPDIFHYVYAVLHHPDYRSRYVENLKRELPRIPFAPDFHMLAKAGRKLAALHVGYEDVKPWNLKQIERTDTPLDWRVETMKLTKEGDAVIYNEHFTFEGIPAEAHEYRLGNRSALDWVIDQYRVCRDGEGNIVSDPNRDDDEKYIANLIARVVSVSVETQKLVASLPPLSATS
ncbi:MAG: hypothetical protein QOH39_2771 [Verrucomicrobiota bacterium]